MCTFTIRFHIPVQRLEMPGILITVGCTFTIDQWTLVIEFEYSLTNEHKYDHASSAVLSSRSVHSTSLYKLDLGPSLKMPIPS